jgi:hypothetical protein
MHKASNDVVWDHLRTGKPNQMRMNQTKQHQTWATGSTAPDTTPSTPLPQGNALIPYPNLRQEKKCAGKKSGYEVMHDINVVNA